MPPIAKLKFKPRKITKLQQYTKRMYKPYLLHSSITTINGYALAKGFI